MGGEGRVTDYRRGGGSVEGSHEERSKLYRTGQLVLEVGEFLVPAKSRHWLQTKRIVSNLIQRQ